MRLIKWTDYPSDYDPGRDTRTPVWETLHHLIRSMEKGEGEAAAGRLIAALPRQAMGVRQLAYRLYTLCERRGWAEDARFYSSITASWDAITAAAARTGKSQLEML